MSQGGARQQIAKLTGEDGWDTEPGWSPLSGNGFGGWAGHKGQLQVNLEFSVRGGITYASTGGRRDCRVLYGPGKLARVLAYMKGDEK